MFVIRDCGTHYSFWRVIGLENCDFSTWTLDLVTEIRNPSQIEENVKFTLMASEQHGTIALAHSFYNLFVIFLSQPGCPYKILQLNREQQPNPIIVGSFLVFADIGNVITYSLDDLNSPIKKVSLVPSGASERGFIRLGRLPFARVGAFYASPTHNHCFLAMSPDQEADTVITPLPSIDIRVSFPCWSQSGDTLLVEGGGQLNWISLREKKAIRTRQQITTSGTSLTVCNYYFLILFDIPPLT